MTWAFAITALLDMRVVAADAHPGDGWFPLPRAPIEESTDVTGLSDGSIVLAGFEGPARRFGPYGQWTVIPRLRATGVVGLADGSVLATAASRQAILRWASGMAAPALVAGSGRTGFRGDGGDARSASLSLFDREYPSSSSVAILADGSVLIPDTGNRRIRAVDPTGVISTVVGTGRRRPAGDGGPALGAALQSPVSVSARPGGGYVIVDSLAGRLRRVDPDGTIRTIARGSDLYDAQSLDDGSVVFTDGAMLRSVLSDGRVTAKTSVPDIARRAHRCADYVGTDGHGGLLIAGCSGRVWIRPALTPAQPFAALRDMRVRPRRVEAVFETTHPGWAMLEVRRYGQTEILRGREVAAGHVRLRSRTSLHGWSRLRVALHTAAGLTARDSLWVYGTHRLSRRQAISLMGGRDQGGDQGIVVSLSGRCHRFGPLRVDCERRIFEDDYDDTDGDDEEDESCLNIVSVTIEPTALAVKRTYPCRRPLFRRSPRWHNNDESPLVLSPGVSF